MDVHKTLETLVANQSLLERRSLRARLRRLLRRANWIFHVSVLLPTAVAVLYYGLIASDVYVSESRFVVRSAQRPAPSGILGTLLQGTAFSRSQDDTYSVRDFALSRDALRELDQKLQIRNAYASRAIAVTDRFPGLDWDGSFENFYRYYRRHVSIDYDPVSSISVLTVHAFTAQQARDINDLLLGMSERLIHELNERSRQDLIQVAAREVKIAEERTTNATLALAAYRNKQSIFEPDRQSMLQLQGVAKLHEELLAVEAQQKQLQQLSPSNPQLSTLKSRAEELRRTIDVETAKVAGGRGSFTSKSSQFEPLALEKEFAEKQLTSALAALETARSEAQRKQLYLERLVQPSVPDYPMEPRRIRSILTVFVLGLIAWGVLSLIFASIKEHTD